MATKQSIEPSLRALAEFLRAERERKGISMNRLAEKAGLSQSTISLIENKKRIPGMDAYLRITLALELSPAKLLDKAIKQANTHQ